MRTELKTARGYDFYEVASVMQKAIRRGDALYAGYFALELFASGYSRYVWKRLLTISAEDCYSALTKEIWALWESFKFINEKMKDKEKGRIFISKAVLLLCECAKSRDSDHLQCLCYDRKMLFDESRAEELFKEVCQSGHLSIPDYAYDVHTLKGKMAGKTKEQFFREEHFSLKPHQPGLFDKLVE